MQRLCALAYGLPIYKLVMHDHVIGAWTARWPRELAAPLAYTCAPLKVSGREHV